MAGMPRVVSSYVAPAVRSYAWPRQVAARARPRSRFGWGLGSVVLAFAWFAALAIGRWNAGEVTNYDLAIFSQNAQSWSRGELPTSTARGLDLLGDHFSPIMALAGGVWRVWPDPRALLLLQAALLASAVGMTIHLASTRLAPRLVVLVMVVALLGRGALTATLFDFHEVAFAAPLMVLLAAGIIRQRFGVVVAPAILLVLVKEDLGLTVMAAGLAWLVVTGRPGLRQALTLVAIGAAGLITAMLVISHFSEAGGAGYLSYFGLGSSATHTAAVPGPGWHRVLPPLLFAATALGVGLRSPLAILAVPTLLWRLASTNASYWTVNFHYDLVLWAVALVAAVDGLSRAAARREDDRDRIRWSSRLSRRNVIVGAAVLSVVFGVQALAQRAAAPPYVITQGSSVNQINELAKEIPPGSRVAALNQVGPHLVSRFEVYHLTETFDRPVDYVMFPLDHKWEGSLGQCEREGLMRSGGAVSRRGAIVLIRLPHRERIPHFCS